MTTWTSLALVVLLLAAVSSREADDRSRFLYAEDPTATAVLEYQLHNAPSRDYTGDEQEAAARNQPGSDYHEERYIKPYFLQPGNGPRVVQYYSPWCGHCQYFKQKYVSVAKEVGLRLREGEPEVNFHAVSCSVYHWICMQNNVNGFPTLVGFKDQSNIPNRLKEKDFTADNIAETIGVHLNAPTARGSQSQAAANGDDFRAIDILGASRDGLARTRETVYRDAALSFTHALRTDIFSRGPLDDLRREVFSDWVDLLYWSLPPTYILHTLINDLRNNIDSVMVSEDNMNFMVDKHSDVINGIHTKWSEQCSKGIAGAGYSCGLWSLFHIVSIGVIERHRAVLGAREQVSTSFVATTLRNYVDNFFDCESCREYFVSMFDSCGFNHCRRFKQTKKLPPPQSWDEFALWLWEVHNDVNTRLARLHSTDSNSGPIASQAPWPPTSECAACIDSTGKWDTDSVLSHLKSVYWPSGVQNFRFVVLKKKETAVEVGHSFFYELIENLLFLGFAALVVTWCSNRRRNVTGRHKKSEDNV